MTSSASFQNMLLGYLEIFRALVFAYEVFDNCFIYLIQYIIGILNKQKTFVTKTISNFPIDL